MKIENIKKIFDGTTFEIDGVYASVSVKWSWLMLGFAYVTGKNPGNHTHLKAIVPMGGGQYSELEQMSNDPLLVAIARLEYMLSNGIKDLPYYNMTTGEFMKPEDLRKLAPEIEADFYRLFGDGHTKESFFKEWMRG